MRASAAFLVNTGASGRVRELAAVAALGLAACCPDTPVPATTPTAPAAPPPAKSVQLNAPGEPVDITAALVAGHVTVVDFWSESCEACVTFGGMLAVGVAQDPRIVIRKIDVGDGFTPIAERYNITALPHYFLYDKRKRLRYDLVGPDCEQAATAARKLAAE